MQSKKKVVSLFGKSKKGHNIFTLSENENKNGHYTAHRAVVRSVSSN